MKAKNAETTRFAIPLRTVLTLLLSNLGKKNLEDEEFEAFEDWLLRAEAKLEEAARLKAERQEFRRFEAGQEAARIMRFEQDHQHLRLRSPNFTL